MLMFISDTFFGIYCLALFSFTKLVTTFSNNLEIVLVLHRRLLSWSGSRVSPRSCPLHYPAVTCKPAATLGPHCGAFTWWF